MKLRRTLLAAGLLLAPFGAAATTLSASTGVAHAAVLADPPPPGGTACANQSQQDLSMEFYNHAGSSLAFADYAHTWYPLQSATGTVTASYATWDLCWSNVGYSGGDLYGNIYLYNHGTSEWLGDNTSNYDEQTATAGGAGTYEEYQFMCLTHEDGARYFTLINDARGGSVQWYTSYHGLSYVDALAITPPPVPDVFYNATGSLFCT